MSTSRTSLEEPLLILDGVVYGLGLEVVEGRFRAWVKGPVFWAGAVDEGASLSSLVAVEEFLAFTVGNQPYNINLEGDEYSQFALEFPASETRAWTVPEWEEQWLGTCVPLANSVSYARQAARISQQGPGWPVGGIVFRLGSGAGQGPGKFFFPLSFDGSPDSRIYVLDAGNARIQVFDIEGNYITQWGGKGSGVGEFDFGSGGSPEDFAGSVAVDSEDFIYVADVGNGRIQKFAP